LILDADNVLHPDFLSWRLFPIELCGYQVNSGKSGLSANPKHRVAILDGLSEKGQNQEMLCKGANQLGPFQQINRSANGFWVKPKCLVETLFSLKWRSEI